MKEKKLLENPNMFAPKIRLISILGKIKIILGYQNFLYVNMVGKPIPLDKLLIRKNEIIGDFFRKNFYKEDIKNFAEIGGNNGFFLFLAKFYGVNNVISYDIDKNLDKLYNSKFYKDMGLKINYNDIFSISEKYDCILGISILHWLIGQEVKKIKLNNTEKILDNIIKKISSITNKVAIIEFVLSEDDVIKKFGHHNLCIKLEDYLKSSNKFFSRYELLGYSNKTRIIYALWK